MVKKRREKPDEEITEIPITEQNNKNPQETLEQHAEKIQEEKRQRRKIQPIYTSTATDGEIVRGVGRALGNIKRVDPQVLQLVQQEAARTGRKEYEVLRDWIQNYAIIRYDTLNKMSVAELYESWLILSEFQRMAIKNFGTYAKIMFGEYMQTFTDIIDESTKRRGGYSPEAKERMLNKMVESFEPMLEILSGLMTKNLAKMMGVQQTTTKTNIPVTITYEDDEK